jgi:hypothetical protein
MNRACTRCGSTKIVPNVPLLDHYGDVGAYSSLAQVEVHGEPSAWIFKDTAAGKVTADICGDCGHVELAVSNFRELYEKYRQAGGG